MRRKRDRMLKQDLTLFKVEFNSVKEAAKFANMLKRVIKSSKIYVRRNNVVCKTHFSADAWTLTFTTVLMQLQKRRIVEPDWIWKYANECADFARARQTWYLITKDDRRVSCKEFIDQWQPLIGGINVR